jgi:hypothetical protein
MEIIAKQKKFMDQFSLLKEIFLGIKSNSKKIALFTGFIFIFKFILLMTTPFAESSLANIQDVFQIQNDWKNTLFSILNSMVSLFIFGIISLGFLFFKAKMSSFKSILKNVISLKYYLNVFFFLTLILLYFLILLLISVPSEIISNNNLFSEGTEFEILKNSLTDFEVFSMTFALIFFVISFPLFIISGFFNYMNYLNYDSPLVKGYFKTFFYTLKNILFWYLPLLLIFIIFITFDSIVKDYITYGIVEVLINSFYISFFGYTIFIIYKNIFPEYDFTEEVEISDKNRILNKYK